MVQIEAFVVSPAEANGSEHQSLCLWVGYYVDYALGESQGGYKAEELPAFAQHFYDLWRYHGECKNGGHAQYEGNIPDPTAWARASQLLGHLGLLQYRQLLDDFIAFATLNEDMIRELIESGQEWKRPVASIRSTTDLTILRKSQDRCICICTSGCCSSLG